MCIQNLVKFCPLVLKILSGNEILTSIKGHNSVANFQQMTLYNPNLDLVNANVYTNFGYILSIGSEDIEQKRNSDINQGPQIQATGCNSFLRYPLFSHFPIKSLSYQI